MSMVMYKRLDMNGLSPIEPLTVTRRFLGCSDDIALNMRICIHESIAEKLWLCQFSE